MPKNARVMTDDDIKKEKEKRNNKTVKTGT